MRTARSPRRVSPPCARTRSHQELDELLLAPRQPARRRASTPRGAARRRTRAARWRGSRTARARRRWRGSRGRAETRPGAARRAAPSNRGSVAATRSVSRRSQKRPRRPDQVLLERRVGGGVRPRQLRVELVDHAPHLGEGAVDLASRTAARRAGTSRRSLGASTWNIGSSGSDAPPERLRLRQLDEHAAPGRRRAGEERERAPRERDAVVLVGRRAPALARARAPATSAARAAPPRRARRCPPRGPRRRSASPSAPQSGSTPKAVLTPCTRARARGRRAAGLRRHPPLGDPLQHARQELVLAPQDAQAQRLLVVAVAHRDGRLRDDGPRVGAPVDEVDGAAGRPARRTRGLAAARARPGRPAAGQGGC